MNFTDGEVLLPGLKIMKTPTWQEKRKEKNSRRQKKKKRYGINFSSLARTFGIKDGEGNVPKNGGQILKQYLEENGMVLENFNYKGKSKEIKFRRKKRKIDGTETSIPSDVTNAEVQKQ